ncbi:MAG: phosphotransferase [Hyphomicrobiaceae bacterium]
MNDEGLFTGTGAVRQAHRFDEERLADWLGANVADFEGPITVEQFRGGQSNPTYKLVTPKKSYVMRRKPPGKLLRGAHAVDREARVISALEKAAFPVPHVYGLCTDDEVIGTWFYVMEMVEGRIFWDATLPQIAREQRPSYFEAMSATLAQLHKLDYTSIGLGDYAKPGNYFTRQISRWTKQYLADEDAGRDPNLDLLIEWLPNNIPAGDETSVVHGDFRIDNMIFHPTEPRVLAVLDWELSTLGHPLADFAYNLMVYRLPPSVFAGLVGADLMALNIPSETDYIESYCRHTGRKSVTGIDFCVAFNMFRFAAIVHGVKGRAIRGNAANEHAQALIDFLPRLSQIGWEQAKLASEKTPS